VHFNKCIEFVDVDGHDTNIHSLTTIIEIAKNSEVVASVSFMDVVSGHKLLSDPS
jgi:hypothetical protein